MRSKDHERGRTAIFSTGSRGLLYVPGTSGAFLRELVDRDVFDGRNPLVTMNEMSGIAEVTRANLVTADTLETRTLEEPNVTLISDRTDVYYDGNDLAPGFYLPLKRGGEIVLRHAVKVDAVAFHLRAPLDGIISVGNEDIPNPLVMADQAAFLLPRAIGYSAEVPRHFFRGHFEVSQLGSGQIRVVNRGDENFDGEVVGIYYDNAGGQRAIIPGTAHQAFSLASSSAILLSPFVPPDDVLAPIVYTIVFSGTLGQEQGAVIGANLRQQCQYMFCPPGFDYDGDSHCFKKDEESAEVFCDGRRVSGFHCSLEMVGLCSPPGYQGYNSCCCRRVWSYVSMNSCNVEPDPRCGCE